MRISLSLLAALLSLPLTFSCARTDEPRDAPWWQMRGLVLSTAELSEVDWPAMAHEAGINTIGTHITPSEVLDFMQTPAGKRFVRECDSLGITVEHQLHAMGELLPRELFGQDSTMFRMDENGRRTPDYNCCAHSEAALEIIAHNAAELARALHPGNHRYYFWLDDNVPVCYCPLCRDYSPSEQELIIENRMLRAIREVDPEAHLAHLAYSFYMDPPRKVKPDEGIFLEFAPIYRSWDVPLTDEDALCPRGYPVTNGDNLRWLEANLEVFPAEDAVVLEYWMDVSLFSRWKRPAVELPWRPDVCRSDLATYARYGLRNVTSFAVYMDAEYFGRFPSVEPVAEYGRLLHSFRHFRGFRDPWDGLSDGTQVSVCTDGRVLSFQFEVEDSTMVVCDGPTERSVDHGDRVELFLSCDDAMGLYYGFEVDPRGKVMDYRNSFYRQFDYGWSGFEAASSAPTGADGLPDAGLTVALPAPAVASSATASPTTASPTGADSLPEAGKTVASSAPVVSASMTDRGYRVELTFPMETLRGWGLAPDGTLHLGLYRADAVRPDEIFWYTLIDPHTPEPDFHVPASLFPYLLPEASVSAGR